ncbi:MAG: GAF domain-containing protein, partial [Gammaproteobacteria bacterium]|nr:GAF domain-containing protein [Gammaproteobacteria bacterium]NIR92515.1 GAF domain-containing protein [Gammaproteobacteria bacterium]NIT51536.1 GAF domain-containing protein [candidate division Zixibacteria bacterium]NIW39401.1 GAF domain-containing protein [candidate division Zixibacteria bacterium]NIX57432.1 GAF domain-containing protein [candidate division Zixibacteria bacterium]
RESVRHIQEYKPYYDWVGVYRLANGELVLPAGWFIGSEPEHQRISLDEGICGAAASDRETIVVDDVRTDPRYLACSIATRSEIVVPIQWQESLYGVLDLDSDTPAAFGTD